MAGARQAALEGTAATNSIEAWPDFGDNQGRVGRAAAATR
jgi:hypothetical protein